jgi:DNA-binding MarR family transcriptional regulator
MKVELKEFNSILGKIHSTYHEAALRLGMSDSKRDILYVLCDKGSSCNQSTLYKKTGMMRSTVNSAIHKLENAGILYLTTGTGRNTCVFLTKKGKKYIEKTVEKLIEIENGIYLN